MSHIFLSFLKHFFKFSLWPYLLVVALIFIVQIFNFKPDANDSFQYFQAYFIGTGIWWPYFPVIPWLAYPVSGFIMYVVFTKIKIPLDTLLRYLIIVAGILTFAFINYGIKISSDLPEYYHHGFLFFVFACCFLVFYSFIANIISNQIETKFTRWVELIGINVTAAYIIQWLFIGNIANEVYKTQNILQLILWFFFAQAVTSTGIYFWSKFDLKFKL